MVLEVLAGIIYWKRKGCKIGGVRGKLRKDTLRRADALSYFFFAEIRQERLRHLRLFHRDKGGFSQSYTEKKECLLIKQYP